MAALFCFEANKLVFWRSVSGNSVLRVSVPAGLPVGPGRDHHHIPLASHRLLRPEVRQGLCLFTDRITLVISCVLHLL